MAVLVLRAVAATSSNEICASPQITGKIGMRVNTGVWHRDGYAFALIDPVRFGNFEEAQMPLIPPDSVAAVQIWSGADGPSM
ncbi:hypothetical protein RM555_25020 [Micromonospora sp. DSM 115977]|uniref:Uncharacterized protein n=1 Tax=Micromonospora reichwaldensis TaxID=3075516 RepID=A0ABU2X291_9ACTN|nr:hypothetical protein [Micromonospora sp. DSM 115977]MDT0532266.1 hypothetical protein [Micromonospora sp. DSM 115977]